jgi:predicted ATPase
MAEQMGNTYYTSVGEAYAAWASAHETDSAEAIAQIRRAIDFARASGNCFDIQRFLLMLAEVHRDAKQPGEGLAVIGEAERHLETSDVANFLAEVMRLKGELLLLRGPSCWRESEAAFHNAIDLARRQAAKSWELRATTSLARLLANQGKRDQARAMLAEIYNWFTEGFDTADLKDAKAQLEELRG